MIFIQFLRTKSFSCLVKANMLTTTSLSPFSRDPVTPFQFKIFRFIFGTYLFYHFYSLVAYGPELFSNEGMIPDPFMNPTWNYWSYLSSGILPYTAQGINGFLNIMLVSAFFFGMGMSQAFNAIVLWYGWAFLFNRNILIANPGLPYVGWLLLACAIIPNPGPLLRLPLRLPYFSVEQLKDINDFRIWTFSNRKTSQGFKTVPTGDHYKNKDQDQDQDQEDKDQDADTDDKVIDSSPDNDTDSACDKSDEDDKDKVTEIWRMPPLIFWGAWFLMALGYSISGIHKLQCESWVDGTALLHVLESLLARNNKLVTLMIEIMNQHSWVLKLHTWTSLFLEITFLPLGIFDRLRFTYWISFMIMHIGILCLIDFTDLTLGVLMIHLFTFDSRWIR